MKALLLTAITVCLFGCCSVAQSTQSTLNNKSTSSNTAAREEEDESESAETALEHAKQSWFKLMQKPNANYFKILRKFKRYFKKHPLEGSGPKEYGVSWLKKNIFYLDVKGRVQPPPPANYNNLRLPYPQAPSLVTDTMAGDWRMLGPRNTVHVGAGVGNNGGYGYCVRMDPTNQNKLFISFVTGGLWVSADNGNAWHLADANMPANTYCDIDVCRGHNNTVYAVSSGAVIKSTDGGMSWNTTALNSSNYSGQGYDIAASPTDSNVVVARWGTNLYRTKDGGATWTVVKTGLNTFSVWDSNLSSEILDWDITNYNNVYLADRGDNQNFVTVYKSTDAGLSFSLLRTLTLPDSANGNVTGWSKVCTATNDTSAVYIMVGSGANAYGHIAVQMFKLDIATGNILLQRINMISGANTAYGSTNALVHGDIAMDIHDENKIVWGSYSQSNAQYSSDNGVTFSTSTSTVHYDLRSIFVMDGKVILGTDGSTLVSTDGGNTFNIVSNSISNHELWGFGSAFNSDLLAAGCNHGPLMIRDYEAPGGWYTVLGADQGNSDFNPLDSVTAYSEGYDTYHVTRTGIKSFVSGSQQIDPGGIYSYFNTLQFHPNLYHTLITHHAGQYPSSVPQATLNIWKNSLIRSDDNGLNVSVIHTFSDQLFREKICMSDTNRIYTVVGLTTNSLMKTTDGGATWSDITPSSTVTGASVRNISDLAVNDTNPNEIWVTYSGVQNTCQVLHSTDGGSTYTNLTTATLTSNPVTKIIFQRGTKGGVYIGSESGVYYRNNSMTDWSLLGTGLPQMDIRFMFINYSKEKLLIGTSRGAWDHNLYEHSSTSAQISASTDRPNCQSPTVQFKDYSVVSSNGKAITYSWNFPGGTPASSKLQNPLVSYKGDSSGSRHSVSLTVTDQYGTSSQTLANFIYFDGTNCCQGPPAGWELTNIGTASVPGTVCYTPSNGNYTLTCNAAGFGDPNDSVPFVYKPLIGNGQIVARVKDVSSTYNYGGGIMIRNSLQPNSAFVFLNSLDTRGIFDQYRTSGGGNTSYQPVTALPMPMWLRLQRRGNVITSAYSSDNVTWTLYHTYTFAALSDTIYAGLSAAGNGCVTDIDSVSVGVLSAFVCNGGSATGCPAFDSIPGKAINFYDYSYLNLPVTAPATNSFTVTGWIKPASVLGNQSGILAWDQGYFYLGQNNDNQLDYVWNSTNATNTWNSGLFVQPNQWSFVAMVVHPDSTSLYLNDQRSTDPTSQGLSAVTNAILGNSNPGAGYFLGQMDEVTVWNRALSTNDIDSLRHLTKEKMINKALRTHDSTLISYFQFNDTLSVSSFNQVDSTEFNFGYGANKSISTAPVGGGISATQVVNGPGKFTFAGTGATLSFPRTGIYPDGNVWISRIRLLPDQYPHASILPNAYWIVDNYGSDSAFSPLASIKLDSAIDVPAASSARAIKLFKRPVNAEGYTWGSFINSGTVATSGNPGSVTFDTTKISSEGQWFVNGGSQAPQADTVAGKALDLTPAGSPVIPLSPVPINSNTFTITFWTKPQGLQHVFSQLISSQAPNTFFGIGISFPGYTDNLNLVYSGSSINYYQQTSINLVQNQWNNIAFVYTPDSVSIYLNGGTPWTFPAASSNTPSGFPPIDLSEAPVTVNADIQQQDGNYKGQLDEISFYNYPLSQEEIQEKMHLTKTPGQEIGLVGYYQFNQYNGSTDTLYDAMGDGTASYVNASNITTSTAPVASGTSFWIPNVNVSGSYAFPGTGVSLSFKGPVLPDGNIVVSRLNSLPDSLPGSYKGTGNQYWIIRNWGTNSSFTSLASVEFTNANIDPVDTIWHQSPRLFLRNANEYLNNWTALCSTGSVSSGSADTAIFSRGCIDTTFGQFFIGELPAPVSLLSFAGQKEHKTALLQWTVSDETSVSRYVVQRRHDNKPFDSIGFLPPTGAQKYSFTDELPIDGHDQYRLKIIDDSSRYIYSNTVELTFHGESYIKVSPNPARGDQTVTITNLSTSEAHIELYLTNRCLFRKYFIAPGASIEVSGLPRGYLFYEATNTDGEKTAGVEIVL